MKRLLVACIAAGCVAATAAAAKLPDVPQSYLFTQAGVMTPLREGDEITVGMIKMSFHLG